jgi:hypothetical protein
MYISTIVAIFFAASASAVPVHHPHFPQYPHIPTNTTSPNTTDTMRPVIISGTPSAFFEPVGVSLLSSLHIP